jgi:hypothetical protein
LLAATSPAQDAQAPHDILETLGRIDFPVSCSRPAQRAFPHAVALLHSAAYGRALEEFRNIARLDPKCAMAYWGEAMTWWHPLSAPPDSDALRQGAAAIQKAASLELRMGREKGYVAALAAFYADYDKIDYHTRAMTYRMAMQRLYRLFPKDNEIATFYAVALLETASQEDPAFQEQKAAAAILEKVFTDQPDHPGAAHYLIHSFDCAPLAKDALLAARSYARSAPPLSHDLHLPSHIFNRLGLWQDSINSNLAAEKAARQSATADHLPYVSDQQLHAMDFLMYAYLQQARYDAAAGVLKEVDSIAAVQPSLVSYYALSAIPARYAVEQGQWETAAALRPASSAMPQAKAITYWARALGNARTGKLDAARSDLRQLQAIHDDLARSNGGGDWAAQVEIQRSEAAAAIAHAEGNNDSALALMRSAVELEDSVHMDLPSPGPVLPARELLADLLLDLHHPEQALLLYQASLRVAPHRLRAVQGTFLAAEAVRKNEASLGRRDELPESSAAKSEAAWLPSGKP